MIRDRFCGAAFMSYVLIIRLPHPSCRCEKTGRRESRMEMHSAHPSKRKPGLLGNTLVTANRAAFSGYNRGGHEFTQHILVRNTHGQAITRLLGGLSGLPAPLPCGAAFARP